MPRTSPNNRAIGYVRVSRVGTRSGASYVSPDEQHATIERLAAAHGLDLIDTIEEENVSGARAAEERRLGDLIGRVESGDIGTIIVWKVSRFSRSLIDGITNAQKVIDAGGRILCGDLDTGAQSGTLLLSIMFAMAQDARAQLTEAWSVGRTRAADRGAWARPDVPMGYVTELLDPADPDAGRRLTIDPDDVTRKAVIWAFEARGRGVSWNALRDGLADRGFNMSRGAVRTMIRSRAYRGDIIEHGLTPNVGAHDAIVDETTWQAAQVEGKRPELSGVAGTHGILKGIVRCASCGGPCGVSGTGAGISYRCRDQRSTRCTGRASLTVAQIDPVILPLLADRMNAERDIDAEQRDVDATRARVEHAEAAMAAHLRVDPAIVGGDAWNARAIELRDMINAANDDVERLQTRLAASAFAGMTSDIHDAPIDAQRAAAGALIDHVMVRRRGDDHTDGRFTIVWRTAA